jgi:Tfp pilus assembly protein PilX
MKSNIIDNQKGIALVTAILMLVVLSVIGVIAVNMTMIGTKITGNTKTSKQAFYLAEAGIEAARELLRTRIAGGSTISNQLVLVRGIDGLLVDSTNVASFSSTDDVPFIDSTSMGIGSYRVFLTNDNSDGVTSTTDTNSQVSLTSFGTGPDNSQAIIQVTVIRVPIPTLPGAITMPGPNVFFNAGSSNASTYTGDATHPAVAVNSATGQASVVSGIQGPPDRSDSYEGMGHSHHPTVPSVVDMVFPDPWGNITQLQTLYQNLKGMADYSSPTDPGFSLGTLANPKLVVLDRDYDIPGGTVGAGILLVTGNLVLRGNFNYDGILLVMGKGSLTRDGAGTGIISGGIYVANIAGPDGNINTTADNTWGTPIWNTAGGGTSDVDYVYSSENNALQLMPTARTSWRQLYR